MSNRTPGDPPRRLLLRIVVTIAYFAVGIRLMGPAIFYFNFMPWVGISQEHWWQIPTGIATFEISVLIWLGLVGSIALMLAQHFATLLYCRVFHGSIWRGPVSFADWAMGLF